MICTLRHAIINALVATALAKNRDEIRCWNQEASGAGTDQVSLLNLTVTAQHRGLGEQRGRKDSVGDWASMRPEMI